MRRICTLMGAVFFTCTHSWTMADDGIDTGRQAVARFSNGRRIGERLILLTMEWQWTRLADFRPTVGGCQLVALCGDPGKEAGER